MLAATPNKSFDPSGGGVFPIMTGAAMVNGIRAAPVNSDVGPLGEVSIYRIACREKVIMCIDCDEEGISRRSFLTGATTAIAGAAFALKTAGQQSAQKTLNDPNIILDEVSFKSGTNTIKGFLARPKKAGRYRMVLIAHGNPGVPQDIRFTAAELAKAGYVSLVYDWGSREPQPADARERDKWVARITSYTFQKLQIQDLQAGINYLREQSFTKRERVGVVGFCGGGRLAFLFSTSIGRCEGADLFLWASGLPYE